MYFRLENFKISTNDLNIAADAYSILRQTPVIKTVYSVDKDHHTQERLLCTPNKAIMEMNVFSLFKYAWLHHSYHLYAVYGQNNFTNIMMKYLSPNLNILHCAVNFLDTS